MQTLTEVIKQESAAGRALGHFNVANLEMLWGVVRAARMLKVPVIIGVSEGERDAIGVPQILALVKSLQSENE